MAHQRGEFYGKGLPKSPRRPNNPNGTPRKLHPHVRKEQKGTVWEGLIDSQYATLEDQGNRVLNSPGRMEQIEATGQLAVDWGGVNHTGISSKAVRDYIKAHGGTARQARNSLIGLSQVSFSYDPKTK